MRKTGLVVIAVVVATALLVWWLSHAEALPPFEPRAADPAAPLTAAALSPSAPSSKPAAPEEPRPSQARPVRVVDVAGIPLEGALIRMIGPEGGAVVLTDEAGAAEVELSPRDSLELRAARGGYQSFTVQVGAQSPPELRIGLVAASSEAALKKGSYEGVGMKFANGTVPDAGSGYLVAALHPEGGAEKAGVRVGDEIIAASGLPAGTAPTIEFLRLIKGPSGSVVTLTVRRGGQTIELNAVRGRLSAW